MHTAPPLSLLPLPVPHTLLDSVWTTCDPRTLVGEWGAGPWRSPDVVERPWGSEPVTLLCPEERPLAAANIAGQASFHLSRWPGRLSRGWRVSS